MYNNNSNNYFLKPDVPTVGLSLLDLKKGSGLESSLDRNSKINNFNWIDELDLYFFFQS